MGSTSWWQSKVGDLTGQITESPNALWMTVGDSWNAGMLFKTAKASQIPWMGEWKWDRKEAPWGEQDPCTEFNSMEAVLPECWAGNQQAHFLCGSSLNSLQSGSLQCYVWKPLTIACQIKGPGIFLISGTPHPSTESPCTFLHHQVGPEEAALGGGSDKSSLCVKLRVTNISSSWDRWLGNQMQDAWRNSCVDLGLKTP